VNCALEAALNRYAQAHKAKDEAGRAVAWALVLRVLDAVLPS